MNKKIWIVSQESSTPSTGYGGRSYYFAKELASLGHEVFLVLSSSSHMLRQKPNTSGKSWYIEEHTGFKVIWNETVGYDSSHDKKRVFGWFQFAFNILKLKQVLGGSPDVVIYSSPPLIPVIGALLLKCITKAKLIFEVRDIWPLTLTEVGNINKRHPFIILSSFIERLSYRFADHIVSNLKFAIEHMETKGALPEKFHWIPNGICLDEIDISTKCALSRLIPKDKFVIGYTGSVGVANYLNHLIDAAILLKNNENVIIVIVGEGAKKQSLIERTQQQKLKNVLFLDAVNKMEVQDIISNFDCCYLGTENINLYRYGISPNKLAEYMYAAKPVLLSFSGQGEIIESNNAGITVRAENPEDISRGILKLMNLSKKELTDMGTNGKNFVIENLTYRQLALKYNDLIISDD